MERITAAVLGAPIDAVSWDAALSRIQGWAARNESRSVFICNVHSVVTTQHDPAFAQALAAADMATPDGAPVAWLMRWLGHSNQRRISGPDLMWRYCRAAAIKGEGIFLYGAALNTLDLLEQSLLAAFPRLKICGKRSPPFRAMTAEEDQQDVDLINQSGASVVWVSLGCPKQELWMAAHAGRVQAVRLGVGAAFDFHAGTVARAPEWLRRRGLEWLHRLACEPRRLGRRYLVTNSNSLLVRWCNWLGNGCAKPAASTSADRCRVYALPECSLSACRVVRATPC